MAVGERIRACHSGDYAARDVADAVVTGVYDVKIAGGVHGDAGGNKQLSAGSRTVVAAETGFPISRHGGDHAGRDLADAVVTGVSDVKVAGGVHSQAVGISE